MIHNATQKEKRKCDKYDQFVGNVFSVFNNHKSTIVSVGCDCGHLLTSVDNDIILKNSTLKLSMKWSLNAQEIVSRMLPIHREKVVKKAEDYARLKKKEGVDRNTLYAIGIPVNVMYPPLCHNLSLPHLGNIHSVDFCEGYLLSCGEDGIIHVYTIDDHNEIKVVQKIENLIPPKKAMAVFCSKKVSNTGK